LSDGAHADPEVFILLSYLFHILVEPDTPTD
jgi:hypothetical protein